LNGSLRIGPVIEGYPVPYAVLFRNTGDADLDIRELRPWRGTRIVSHDKTVAPGKEGRIELELRTLGAVGATTRGITVLTNEKTLSKREVQIELNVEPQISLTPNRVFLRGFPDDSLTQDIVIQGNMDAPLQLSSPECSIPDKAEIALQTIEQNRTYRLTVRNRQTSPGSVRGRVLITTSYPMQPKIMIPFFINIIEDIEIIPTKLDFGSVSGPAATTEQASSRLPAESQQATAQFPTHSFFVRLNRTGNMRIQKIAIENPGFTATTNTLEEGRVYRIDVTAKVTELKKGQSCTDLLIHTDYPGKPVIRIPVEITVN
jgi:hypothetical protein